MPIYEFYCDSCGHEFEKIVSFSATQAPACPSCEADSVSRRMSRPAIHFKGSGWYITDSKKSNGNGSGTNGGSTNGSNTNGSNTNGSNTNGSNTDGSSTKTESKSESPAKAEKSESTTKSESSSEKASAKTDA